MDMELGKLFVGGISWDTNENRLREYFQCFGEVVEAMIMKDRATGRARGFGFIVFADPAVAERVVTEKHVIDGRTVEAKKAVPRDDPNTLTRNNSSMHGSPGLVRTKKIFVGGLASTVTESDFKKCFEQFGTITDVVVMYDHNTQRPRGFGFITYDSEDAVDKVLYKTFHELNGKMVEVKRAVPKELSPGPSRGQLSGFSYGLRRINSLLNDYSRGYNPTSIGGYGRLSPVTIGHSGFSSLSPGYGTGLNFEPDLCPSYGINANLNSYFGHGQGLNTSFVGNSNRYSGTIAYGGTSGVNSSLLNSANHNLWGNGSHNFATNSANSRSFMGSGNRNMGMGSFSNVGALWSSSPPGQDGRAGSTYTSGNLNYGSRDFSCTSPGYGRNSGSNVKLMSSYIANGGHDGTSDDIFEGASLYEDSTWRSSPSELYGSGSYGYGLGNAASDVFSKNSTGYIGGYGISSRQPTKGIAA